MSPVDPRLAGNALGIQDPLAAQLAALQLRCGELQRQIDDLRGAATIQVGPASPIGFNSRQGTPYGRSSDTSLWLNFPTGWRGISLPLTS
jgi:hypothetical protein